MWSTQGGEPTVMNCPAGGPNPPPPPARNHGALHERPPAPRQSVPIRRRESAAGPSRHRHRRARQRLRAGAGRLYPALRRLQAGADALRKALGSRYPTRRDGKDWYQQTPAERHDNRTLRSPWWARVTRNTLDLATYTLPELLYERLAEQGADYSILFPNDVLAPLGAGDEARQPLHRAINHFHADQYRKYADRLTPVAGIP